MKYEELCKNKVVETPDGEHLRVISWEALAPELRNLFGPLSSKAPKPSRAKVTVQLPDGNTRTYRVWELKSGCPDKLAEQAMATFFPKPKE
tara:strand:- start:133 stop:405 length:273 start_codon:yes stop_codon:yes gene_type:complete